MTADFLSECSDPQEAFLDSNLAKLGDTLVNFIYSLARSKVLGRADGTKVSNRILSDSLSEAGLRSIAPSRVDRHRLGDVTEAIIAYAWLEEEMSIEEASNILASSLDGTDFEDRKDVRKGAKDGFRKLLNTISKRLEVDEC